MDRRMKKVEYRPKDFRTMDPSFRFHQWCFERRAGHMFADSTRHANLHASLLALSIATMYTVLTYWTAETRDNVNKMLDYGKDADKILEKKKAK